MTAPDPFRALSVGGGAGGRAGGLSPSWRDHDDRPTTAPSLPAEDAPAFYVRIGAIQRDDYQRNAFARGTAEEIAALRGLVPLEAGTHVLDVGCGDARHLRALARDPGVVALGIDVSPDLVASAVRAAAADGVDIEVEVADARALVDHLGARAGSFDVVWTLCQGGLGTSPQGDPAVVAGLAAAVRPGGFVVATFFHALFAARHLAPGDAFDPVHLVHHQRTEVRGPEHTRETVDLWTSAQTVPGAVRLCTDAGLEVVNVRGVEPGAFGRRGAGEVALDDPELLVVARRPPG